jgi:hypothetical protein
MGRETVLTNVTWTHGTWPVWQPIRGEIEAPLPPVADIRGLNGTGYGYVSICPILFNCSCVHNTDVLIPYVLYRLPPASNGTISFKADTKIPKHFVHWRPPIADTYASTAEGLRLKPSKLNLTGLDGNSPGPGGITFISRRQEHSLFEFEVDVDFKPAKEEEEAGISLFLSQVSPSGGLPVLPTCALLQTTSPPLFHPYIFPDS